MNDPPRLLSVSLLGIESGEKDGPDPDADPDSDWKCRYAGSSLPDR